MMRVAINGFGRIGRALLRAAWQAPAVDIVAINDLGDLSNLAYLLQHDSVYGRFPGQVSAEGGELLIGAKHVKFLQEREPARLPWKDLGVDVAVESTGVFDSYEKASAHLAAGARRVVITAPVRDSAEGAATVLIGINEEKLQTCTITSNASCTTNAASPLVAILGDKLGIERALLITAHAVTATQSTVDSPVKGADKRRGRAAAHNIVPSSTGAAIATTLAHEWLAGKFDGIAIRVPVICGSLVDITFIAARDTSAEEVNGILEAAAQEPRWQGIFATSREPLVSSDIVDDPHAALADLSMTRVVRNLVKVLAWYDNEMGYAHTLLRHIKEHGKNL